MSFVENVDIFSNNDKLNIESKDLKRCIIEGSKERKNVKLQIEKLEVPEKVNYEISNLIVENDVINELSGISIKLTNCTIQNIDGLLAINQRKYRELKNVELSDEKLVINTSDALDDEYKFYIDCTKSKEITQEMLDNFAKLCREGEQLTLNFTIEQLKEIQNNGLVIDKVCGVSTEIENASELSAQDAKEMIEALNLKYVKIKPKENQSFYSHHIYEATEYQKSREVLDKILEGLDPNDSNKAKLLAEIYKRLAFHMKYDYDAVKDEKIEEERKFSSRNLVGGLLEGRCVCAGYAEILRNACAICGIEARYISSKEELSIDEDGNISEDTHAFNQVKIDGVWYNVDLTWDRDRIVKGQLPQYFLKNDLDFKKMGRNGPDGKYAVIRTHIPVDYHKFDKCDKNYSQEKIEELFDPKKQPKYLVSIKEQEKVDFELPGQRIKNALERDEIRLSQGTGNSNVVIKQEPKPEPIRMTTTRTEESEDLEHKFSQTDLVDETAVLYPDGKNGDSLGIEYLSSSQTSKNLSDTEIVTKEILEDRAKGNLPQRLKNSNTIEELRKIGNGSLTKGLILLGASTVTATGEIIGLSNSPDMLNSFLNNGLMKAWGITIAGAFGIEYMKELSSSIYNSALARRIRSKLGISPDPRKLRTNIAKSSNRIIKTFATKKANPRTPIKYISKKNDQLLYNMLGEHIPYSTEFDSAIEQRLLETEIHLRSVELCDGILYSWSGIEESLYDGEVYVAKYWRTKNHPNSKDATEVEEFETHKDSRDNINPKDARDREVIAYYKRDSKGKLYMFGMGDKDTTVFYDREEPLSVESSKVKKGVQKEITTAEEIMGLEIRDRVKKPFLPPTEFVAGNGKTFISRIIPGKIQDIIKIDGAILGYSEKDAKKGKDGIIRDENTAFFLVSVIGLDGKEEYYFIDSNYEYSKVKVGINAVFGNSKPIESSKSQDILVNISTDENKQQFEKRKILAEFESADLDENGNPCPKKRIAVTRNSDGRLQVIEPYGEKDGKRYACLLPQTICMDGRVREKYEERHQEEHEEAKKMFSFNFESEDSRREYKSAAEALPVAIEAYGEYAIDPKDIVNQKGIILKLVSKIKNKQNNKKRGDNDARY